MTAVWDKKNRTVTLTDTSADEVLKVLLGLSDGSPEVVELLHQVLSNQETIMGTQEQNTQTLADLTAAVDRLEASEARLETRVQTLLDADVTHSDEQAVEIAALKQEIIDLQNADNGIPAAALQPLVDRVTAIGTRNDAFKAAAVEPPPPVDPNPNPAG